MDALALDTETTGVDLHHGAKPFLVTTYSHKEKCKYWEWDVDPLTREPQVIMDDVQEIFNYLVTCEKLVLHNPKFDVTSLSLLENIKWDWSRTFDTLHASHVLNSEKSHKLDDLAIMHLGVNIKPIEDKVEVAVKQALKHIKKEYPEWRLAKEGLPDMPSVKGSPQKDKDDLKPWKNDMWVLRALAQEESYPDDHPYWHLVADYANADSEVTLLLWDVLEEKLKDQGLWEIYLHRNKLPAITYKMENHGISLNSSRLHTLEEHYKSEFSESADMCVEFAKDNYDYELSLPNGSSNNSLKEFCFDERYLNLPVIRTTPKGEPSLNEDAKNGYLDELEEGSPEHLFMTNIAKRSKLATSLGYIESYKRFWLHNVTLTNPDEYKLYSSINMTGTKTLRPSSSNPNSQQISSLKDSQGKSLRYAFGPAPGREWWALDFDNIELRIPAYESGEPEMIDLFERPNDPPYFGSYHLLVFNIMHPVMFGDYGPDVKTECKQWYKKTKNGNFSDQYNGGQRTVDRAFGVKGAKKKIANRLPKRAQLNKYWIDYANDRGYVETIPDKSIEAKRGYPLWCPMGKWGVLPTTPLSFHVQGTACWVATSAMIKCQEYLDSLNSKVKNQEGMYYMIMYIHDELVFDFPFSPRKGNLGKVRKLRMLMESCGDDIGVPLTCGVDYHPNNWSNGYSIQGILREGESI